MIDVIERVLDAKQKKIKTYPCNTNRASELGHPCVRYLVHRRLDWTRKRLHSLTTQFIFDGGNMIEDLAIDDLKEAGFQIMEQQRSFEIPKEKITGHLDLKIGDGDGVYPVEIKGLQHYDFLKLNTIQDFHDSKKPWIRKYVAQLQMYLYGSEHERGLFYIKSKLTYEPKVIWVSLDYEYVESLLQKAKTINEYVDKREYPEPMDYEEGVCGRCDFSHLCCPDRLNQDGLSFIDDEKLEGQLKRFFEIKDTAKEYKDLEKQINDTVKNRDKLVIGNYLITGQTISKAGFDIPDDIKAQYKVDSSYWKKKIVVIEND